jgi:SpoVK/Ycf46/Vps4 family AAA+-type ATPase
MAENGSSQASDPAAHFENDDIERVARERLEAEEAEAAAKAQAEAAAKAPTKAAVKAQVQFAAKTPDVNLDTLIARIATLEASAAAATAAAESARRESIAIKQLKQENTRTTLSSSVTDSSGAMKPVGSMKPVGADAQARAGAIERRFSLASLSEPHKGTIMNLVQNGLYYMTVGNSISALASFSSAASYAFALKQIGGFSVDDILKNLLGYVEKLQEEAKKAGSGGGSGGPGGKDGEGNDDWDADCQTFCEEDKGKLCGTFKDVIGMKKEKEVFFNAIVYPLIYPNLYTKAAKGILLYGPPGTGKTFIIKAAVRELATRFEKVKVLFFPLTGADLKGKYVGETEKKIVRAYTCAARRACQMTDAYNLTGPPKCKTTPEGVKYIEDLAQKAGKSVWQQNPQYVSVVFIDEFDAVGGDRSKDESGMTANAVNTMLQMMDGLQSFGNVITICATNFPWNLDSALLRRFNEQIYCNVPALEDIKKLITYEQETRLKFVDDNKQKYCATKMSKVFDASAKLKELYPTKDEKKSDGDPCEKKGKEPSIIDFIDTSYMNDKSPAMTAIVAELAEKNYSNSDVSSVMQKAFNSVAESALRSSLWIVVTYDEKSYWISRMTKLRSKVANQYTDALKKLQNDAALDTNYDVRSTASGSHLELPANELTIPEGVYLDKNSVKSIFGDDFKKDDANNEIEIEQQVTSINYNVAQVGLTAASVHKFVNIRYINDLPSILMFNDMTIADMFYDIEQVASLRTELAKKDVRQRNSQIALDVIFSRVLDIDYNGDYKRIDGIDTNKQKLSKLLDDIVKYVEVENGPKKEDTEITTGLKAILTATAPFLAESATPTKESEEIGSLWGTVSANPRETLLALVDGKLAILGRNKDKGGVPNLWNLAVAVEEFQINEVVKLNIVKNHFKNDIIAAVANKDLPSWNFKEGKITTDITAIKNYIDFHTGVVNFMTEGEVAELNKFVDDSKIANKLTGDYAKNNRRLSAYNIIVNTFREINKAKNSIFKQEASSTKKIFYFKSTIHPLQADWVQYKASGPGVGSSKGIAQYISGGLGSAKEWVTSFFTGVKKDTSQLENTISARISEAGISPSKYLLTRATAVGVCDMLEDKPYYRIRTGAVPFVAASTPATKGGRRPNYTKRAKKSRNNTTLKQGGRDEEVALSGGGPVPAEAAKIKWFDLNLLGSKKKFGVDGSDWNNVFQRMFSLASPVERALFNNMLGYFYTFKSQEDNIYVCNLMFAEVFGGDSLELGKPLPPDGPTLGESLASALEVGLKGGANSEKHTYSADWWSKNLNTVFQENYENALQKRERVWTQIREYCMLDLNENVTSQINLKRVNFSNAEADSTKFLSFYMDASYIASAIKGYPSTYNPVTGQQLEDYNKNRTKFLEDFAAGKYDKKKG